MKTLDRQILKTLFLGIVVALMSIGAAYVEFWARFHMERFESRLGGALFLLSSLIILFAGVLFAWMLPMNVHVKSRRRAAIMAFALGLIPGITLILRILHWSLILPPFNYAIRNWTMLSATPPLWLGLTLGWWLQVWRKQRLSANE